MRVTSIQVLTSFALVWFGPTTVRGQAAAFRCNSTETCVQSLGMSCDEAVVVYSFAPPESCCIRLEDGDASDSCNLFVTGGENCYYQTRFAPCTVGEVLGELGCVGNFLVSFVLDFESTEDCPASEYELKYTSDDAFVFPLELTLTGAASTWTDEDVADWELLTASYTESFYNENNVGYTDVISVVDIYDAETIVDTENDTVTVFYGQTITWRTDVPNATAISLLAEVFNSENGKQGYLSALQAANSTSLSAVTAVSDLQLLEPIVAEGPGTFEPIEPEGSEVGSGSTTPPPIETVPEDEIETEDEVETEDEIETEGTVGVTITEGDGEAIEEEVEVDSASKLISLIASAVTVALSAIAVY